MGSTNVTILPTMNYLSSVTVCLAYTLLCISPSACFSFNRSNTTLSLPPTPISSRQYYWACGRGRIPLDRRLCQIVLSATHSSNTPPSQPPIPISELYPKDELVNTTHSNCTHENILYVKEFHQNKCLISPEVIKDYRCRYNVGKKFSCYCCGKITTYVELGKICTKFCL